MFNPQNEGLTLLLTFKELYFSRFLPVKVHRVPAGFVFGFGFIGFWYFHDFSGSGLTGFSFKVRVLGFLGSRVGTNMYIPSSFRNLSMECLVLQELRDNNHHQCRSERVQINIHEKQS